MTSDPIILTTPVYTQGCHTSTSNSARPVPWPSSPSPITHSRSSDVPLVVSGTTPHPPGSAQVFSSPRHLPQPGPSLLHLCGNAGQILQRSRPACGALQVRSQVPLPSSAPASLCTTLCPACPELELPDGDPCRSFDTSR